MEEIATKLPDRRKLLALPREWTMPRQRSLYFLLCTPLLFAVAAFSSTYSKVIVYGDSHSDNGNVYRQLGIPGAPYWNGRWSNGPVAVEDLATSLRAPLADNAWAGATTGIGNLVDGGTTTRLGNHNLPGMTTSFNATKHSFTPGAPANRIIRDLGRRQRLRHRRLHHHHRRSRGRQHYRHCQRNAAARCALHSGCRHARRRARSGICLAGSSGRSMAHLPEQLLQ